jgi:hypothetical protein
VDRQPRWPLRDLRDRHATASARASADRRQRGEGARGGRTRRRRARDSRVPEWGYAAGQGGNGTGNAVVAAYILAGELAAADGDHSAAFARYELLLRDYVAGGQKQAAGAPAFLAPATWKKIRRRNRLLKLLAYMPAKGFMRYISTRTATAIKLPDYSPAPSNADRTIGR